MNMWRPPAQGDLSDDAKANIARIQAMWTDARARFGAGGPFLFGTFSAADAMYAPVVSRFETYAIDVSAPVAGLHGGDDRAAGVRRMAPAPRSPRPGSSPRTRPIGRRCCEDRLDVDRAGNCREPNEVFVDHVGYFVADLEAAGAQLERLGFRVSLANVQTNADAQRRPEALRHVEPARAAESSAFSKILAATHDTPLADQFRQADRALFRACT